MGKCADCGFPHAIPGYCSNCGSSDPLPSRRLLWLAVAVFTLVILAALASIPISLYFERSAVHRDYPPAPAVPTPTPQQQ